MVESERQHLLSLVPIGRQQALTTRDLWRALGQWGEAWVKKNLVELFNAGLIERTRQITPQGFQWLWYRDE